VKCASAVWNHAAGELAQKGESGMFAEPLLSAGLAAGPPLRCSSCSDMTVKMCEKYLTCGITTIKTEGWSRTNFISNICLADFLSTSQGFLLCTTYEIPALTISYLFAIG
jgi:hypothetical protein